MSRDPYASLKHGLVGAWIPSISGSGLLLPDLSGRGNNGSLVGMDASDWVSGQYGRALDFDGSNDTAQVSFNRLGFQQATISFFAFVRNTGNMLFVQVGGLGGVFLSQITTGKLLAFFDGTTANNTSSDESNTTIAANQWYHIAATNDGSTTRYFINGILDKSYSDTILQNTGTVVWIGSNANTQQFVNGQLDDIRIYNRALTEPEIRLLASRPGIGLQPSPTRFIAREKKTGLRRKILTGQT